MILFQIEVENSKTKMKAELDCVSFGLGWLLNCNETALLVGQEKEEVSISIERCYQPFKLFAFNELVADVNPNDVGKIFKVEIPPKPTPTPIPVLNVKVPASIIIPTYNKKPLLQKTLMELLKQIGERDEILVIDDGSDDGTGDMVKQGFKSVNYIWQERKGFRLSTARNKGILKAKNDCIILLDADCYPEPNHINNFKAQFRQGLLLSGGINFQGNDGSIKREVVSSPQILDAYKIRGGNICFSKMDALKIGLFDEEFNGYWGCEDTWFGIRMAHLGIKAMLLSSASVMHQYHSRLPPHIMDITHNRDLLRKKTNELGSLNKIPVFPKIKILYLISTLDIGGAETYLKTLVENLDSDCFAKYVVVLNSSGTLYPKVKEHVDYIHCLEDASDKKEAIREIVSTVKPDYIHVINLPDYCGEKDVLRELRHKGNKMIASIFMPLYHNRAVWNEWLSNTLSLSPYLEYLITDSDENASILPRAQVILHGIDTLLFRPSLKTPKTIAWIGRFTEEKGAHIALDIASQLKDYSFTMIGTGSAEMAKSRNLPNVAVKLSITREEVAEILSKTSYFLVTSPIESCPISLLEAMSSGCCCICTRVGQIPKIITDGVNGYIVPHIEIEKLQVGNPTLTNDMNVFYNDVSRYIVHNIGNFDLAVGEEARRTIIENHSLEEWIEQYEFLYGRNGKRINKKRIAFLWPLFVDEEEWENKKDSMQHAISMLSKKHTVISFSLGTYDKRTILNGIKTLYYRRNELIKVLKEFQPDILVLNSLFGEYVEVIKEFPEAFKILYEFGGDLKNELMSKVDLIFVQQGFRRDECIKVNNLSPHKVIVNPFCVETDTFKKYRYDAIMIADFRRDIKRQHLLINAWKKIDGDLLLVGKFNQRPPYCDYLSEMKHLAKNLGLSDRIHFIDVVEHERLPGLIRSAKIGILTSSREGGSRVLLEMMSCGLPVIVCSDCEGNANRVKDKETGLIVNPDEDSVAEAVNYLLKNDSERVRMGDNASREVAEKYPNERMLRIFEKAIDPKTEISIITTSLDKGEFIEDCLQSVQKLRGNYKVNHIIMDAGSTDGTIEILRKYPVYINIGDKGQTDALNKAMGIINKHFPNTQYVGWLNADDYYHPDFLEESVNVLKDSSIVGMSCSNVANVTSKGDFMKIIEYTEDEFMDVKLMATVGNTIIQPSALIKKEVFDKLEKTYGFYFNPEYDMTQDYELWYRIFKEGYKIAHINKVLAYLRNHPKQLSRLKTKEQIVERLKVLENFRQLVSPSLTTSTTRSRMEIKIYDAVLQRNGRRITNEIEVPEQLKQFFRESNFYVEYDKDVSQVPLSILNIPALASIIHSAWAIGCDVALGEIDETYFKGLEEARQFLKSSIPSLPFTTEVIPQKVVNNRFPEMDEKGLLFSGGCDSTASYIKYRNENPKLIIVMGSDIPTDWTEFWEKILDKYAWMNLLTIKSNSNEIYMSKTLASLGSKITEGYRGGYSFTIDILGLCAPLAIVEHIGELMLSSTYPSKEYGDKRYPWTQSRPQLIIDPYLKWANVQIRDVLHEYTTNEKVKYIIKPYFDKNPPLYLRSCGNHEGLNKFNRERLNCDECDKCQRVIGMLIVNGIDPSICGFKATPETYEKIRKDIINRRWNADYLKYHWMEIQKCIPEIISDDFNGSKTFLEWLKSYKFG